MNSQEKNKFLGMLYDILIDEGIIKYEDKPKDLKEKKERLEKYLAKLERVQDKSLDNDRYLNMIKKLYYDRYIIKESDISDNYLRSLEQQYLDQGHGHVNLVNPENDRDRNLRNEHIQTVIREQKDSLDNWLNYFLSEDSSYLEMWAKVWAFQGMLHIGNINKNKDGYDRRSKTTVNPFVSFDSEILGKCVELVKESFDKKELTDEEIKKLVSSGSFTKLYGKLLANKKQIKTDTTEGVWIKYNRETNQSIEDKLGKGLVPEHIKLYDSLQGYNTGWCTAGARDTAKSQILGGDFYVYYSKNKEGEYKIPRLAIRMQGNNIGEVRGIASGQNIETNMEEILEEKLKEFPDKDNYERRVSDMKTLTTIYNKHLKDEELTEEELIFLYEIYDEIEGFGYQKDPRINEILEVRNKRKDLAYIFECTEDEIGLTEEDFESGRKLKYYEGDLDLDYLESVECYELPEILKGDLELEDLEDLFEVGILILPSIITGDLDLSGLTSAEGLKLPQTINGDLDLSCLTSAEDLELPTILNGSLDLSGLTSAEGLKLPQTISGSLYLNGLASAEDLVLPTILNGSLDLRGLTSAEGLKLPQTINGSLYLNGLASAEGLVLPTILNGNLFLCELTSADGLVLPTTINGYFDLRRVTNVEGLVLPTTISGDLDLSVLRSAKDLVFPNTINGDLDLSRLTSAEGLVLPTTITGVLRLNNLISAKALVLPTTITGVLRLNNLTSAEGLIFPNTINGDLDLNGLASAEGLKLPQTINGSLYLNGLISAEGLKLPQTINGSLYLNGLTSAEGLIFPNTINGDLDLSGLTNLRGLKLKQNINSICVYGDRYTQEQVIEMQRQEDDHLKNNLLNKLKMGNQVAGINDDIINGDLHLRYLKSAVGLIFPNMLNGSLYLDCLTRAKDLVLPITINGDLKLNNLLEAQGLEFPEYIKGNLDLDKLAFAKGLLLPEKIGGSLNLRGLINGKDIRMPEIIGGDLYLGSIRNVYNLELPEKVDGKIYLDNCCYTLEQVIELQNQQKEEFKKIEKDFKSVRFKQKGFISNTIIILNIILFGVLCFILTLLFIK